MLITTGGRFAGYGFDLLKGKPVCRIVCCGVVSTYDSTCSW